MASETTQTYGDSHDEPPTTSTTNKSEQQQQSILNSAQESGQPTPKQNWQEIATAHLSSRNAKIPKEWLLPSALTDQCTADNPVSVLHIPHTVDILTPAEITITESPDATFILRKLESREWTALAVTTAFCKRAAIATQLTNCLTEICFDEALRKAKELDEYLEKEGKVKGPLHGLPISVKDSFHVKGTHASIGFVLFLERGESPANSPLVDILTDLGAVVYCKTNVPQTLMTADSHNNIFGRTLNPKKLTLSAGGSTGGEGALNALRGSVLGVGTDIAGSIRIPSLANGLYGFKPSSARIPGSGQARPGKLGSPGIAASTGPMGNSVRDLELFTKSVLQTRPWEMDASALAVPWREVGKKERLTIGILPEDPTAPLAPPVLRALRLAHDKLEKAGHELVLTDNYPALEDCNQLAWDFFRLESDNGAVLGNIQAGGEPVVPSVAAVSTGRDPKPAVTVDELFDLNWKRTVLKQLWLNTFGDLDVIMMPAAPHTAIAHDTWNSTHYTVVWNLIDYPSIVIPFGRADSSIDKPRIDIGPDLHKPQYDAELVHGLPTSIQFVGRPLQDEELLSAAAVVEAALRT